ncbi:hypothetical protein GAMM_130011 [Gammaproteobacteria bacterium]
MQFNNMQIAFALGLFETGKTTFTNDEVDYGYFATEGKVKATGEKVRWEATNKVWELKPTVVNQLSEQQAEQPISENVNNQNQTEPENQINPVPADDQNQTKLENQTWGGWIYQNITDAANAVLGNNKSENATNNESKKNEL